jgi:hypothetical protein
MEEFEIEIDSGKFESKFFFEIDFGFRSEFVVLID